MQYAIFLFQPLRGNQEQEDVYYTQRQPQSAERASYVVEEESGGCGRAAAVALKGEEGRE